jgi:RHS repeat-associated protein
VQGSPISKYAFVAGLGHPTEYYTGLEYLRARWMDPVTGTFVSEDPAQDGENWFGYCYGCPSSFVDPTGTAGTPTTTLSGGWGIRIDGSPGESVADMHIWRNGKEVGSIFNNGTWKHLGNLSKTEAKSLIAALQDHHSKRVKGWSKALGRAGFTAACISSLDAYLQQDPLGFVAITLDCAGAHDTAAQVDRLNGML